MGEHPVSVTVTDDLQRNRWTVFFRLFLAIPLFIWFYLWSAAAVVAAVMNWFITLLTGRSPEPFHNFLSAYVRYFTHLSAYLFLAAGPYPSFTGERGYPVDVDLGPSLPQNRWKTGFRIVLGIPAFMLASVLTSSGPSSWNSSGRLGGGNASFQYSGSGVALTVAVFAWFAIMARGRMPQGFRDLIAYCLRYGAQAAAYALILTDRYPDADPALPMAFEPAPPHPIRLTLDDDPRRSRLTVFFRFLLAIPHLFWLVLWGIAAFFAAIGTWAVTTVRGRPPASLHRFLSAYVRYNLHVYAYLSLVAGPFPGFNGQPGYPVDVALPPPGRQGRWGAGFRLVLAMPALVVNDALAVALCVVAVLSWFASLVTSREPLGLQRLGAFSLRYAAQTNAYALLVTERYPYSGPGTHVADEQLALVPE